MTDDIFCKIISGEVKADFVYRDDEVVVFKDLHPKAPVHLLAVPAKHFAGIGDFSDSDSKLLGHVLQVAHRVAHEQGLAKGYRLIINEGEDGHKIVPHMHVHVLGGRPLGPKIVQED